MNHIHRWVLLVYWTLFATAGYGAQPANGKGDPAEGYDYNKYLFKVEADPRKANPQDEMDAHTVRRMVQSLEEGYQLPAKQKFIAEIIRTPKSRGIKELEREADAAKIGMIVFVEVTEFSHKNTRKVEEISFGFRHRMSVRTTKGWRELFDNSPILSSRKSGLAAITLLENPLYFSFPQKVLPINIKSKKRNPNGLCEITASITNHFVLPISDFTPEVVCRIQTDNRGNETAQRLASSTPTKLTLAPGQTATFSFSVNATAEQFRTIEGILACEVKSGH